MKCKTKIAAEKSQRMKPNETNKTKWNEKLNKKHIQRGPRAAWNGMTDGGVDLIAQKTKRMNERRLGIRASLGLDEMRRHFCTAIASDGNKNANI